MSYLEWGDKEDLVLGDIGRKGLESLGRNVSRAHMAWLDTVSSGGSIDDIIDSANKVSQWHKIITSEIDQIIKTRKLYESIREDNKVEING